MKKQNIDDLRTTAWLPPTGENIEWLKNEIKISNTPNHSPRVLIREEKNGRLALARSGASE